jgi:hypothetical protein
MQLLVTNLVFFIIFFIRLPISKIIKKYIYLKNLFLSSFRIVTECDVKVLRDVKVIWFETCGNNKFKVLCDVKVIGSKPAGTKKINPTCYGKKNFFLFCFLHKITNFKYIYIYTLKNWISPSLSPPLQVIIFYPSSFWAIMNH